MIDIAKARALCAAATPGPWTFTTCYGVATVQHGPDRDAIAHAVDYLQVGDEYDNASFIASARTLLPEALDALEQERAVCVAITTALKQAIVERDPLKAEVERLTQSDRNVILALKAENTRLASVLEKIAYAGSDCPPARELEAFYRSQLHYCIGTAARALTPAAGGEDV
jgi:hypothetical protein